LISRGFAVTDVPCTGDLVVYLRSKRYPRHFGLFDDGKVISKLSYGHIVRHDLDLIPTNEDIDAVLYMRNSI